MTVSIRFDCFLLCPPVDRKTHPLVHPPPLFLTLPQYDQKSIPKHDVCPKHNQATLTTTAAETLDRYLGQVDHLTFSKPSPNNHSVSRSDRITHGNHRLRLTEGGVGLFEDALPFLDEAGGDFEDE
jgi:hypothetical protein